MLNKITINNLQLLATHSIDKLGLDVYGKTLIERQGKMASLTEKQFQEIKAQCAEVHPRAWVPIKIVNGKIFGLYARTLVHKIHNNEPIQELEAQALVTIHVGNSAFSIDKNQLAEASPVFETMLFGCFKETQQESIELLETSEAAFKSFVSFLEDQEIMENDPAVLAEFYAFADRYQIEPLKDKLQQIIQITDIHAFQDRPDLYVQMVSAKSKDHAKKLSKAIFKVVEDNKNDPQLILTAKKALIGFINHNQVPLWHIVGKPLEVLLEWFGEALPDLEYADFNFLAINNKELGILIKGPSRLTHLLMPNSLLGRKALDVLQFCPNLLSLNIIMGRKLDEDALDVLKNCPKLQSLSIGGCDQLKENALDVLINCPNLRNLDTVMCKQFKELTVLQYCRNLESLDIRFCKKLKELDVLQYCRNLESLDIRFCKKLKEDTLDVLQNCQKLQRLDVRCCQNLSNDSILKLTQLFPQLQISR